MADPMINGLIEGLLDYGLLEGLIEKADISYARNVLLSLYGISGYDHAGVAAIPVKDIQTHLDQMVLWAYEQGLIASHLPPLADLFSTKVMQALSMRPSEVNRTFDQHYQKSPRDAADWFYHYAKAINYIQTARVNKNIIWKQMTDFGEMVMTINLSKPEKDPKSIMAEAKQTQTHYPKCLLCVENVGFEGHMNHPARQTHRVIPLTLNKEPWFFQYSPYGYYHEHAIVINEAHTPMKITHQTYERLCDFVDWMPHYFVGSNADLPLVGGSMLSHDHYQAGHYKMPMEQAQVKSRHSLKAFPGVSLERLDWPLTVIRLRSDQREHVIGAACHITDIWKTHDDAECSILSHTHDTSHHTVTPIVRRVNGVYEIDVVLRDNQVSKAHPEGIFHPHRSVHPVKKENIGLIEVMGLAVLPDRLLKTMEVMIDSIEKNQTWEAIAHHEEVTGFEEIYHTIRCLHKEDQPAAQTVRQVIGDVFVEGLTHAGVFKHTQEGDLGFGRLIERLNQ